MIIRIDAAVRRDFPGLEVLMARIWGVRVRGEDPELHRFKGEVIEEVKRNHDLESLKDVPVLRAYRDFFWRIGIDPTKTRPAAEALIRRILRSKPLQTINTLVDAYNLASIRSCVSIGAFDFKKLKGDLLLRFAKEGENFWGIGMNKAIVLRGNEPVVSDGEKLIAIYPYRDSDATKVTEDTEDVLLLICGVPGIGRETLEGARRMAVEYIRRFCGGTERPV